TAQQQGVASGPGQRGVVVTAAVPAASAAAEAAQYRTQMRGEHGGDEETGQECETVGDRRDPLEDVVRPGVQVVDDENSIVIVAVPDGERVRYGDGQEHDRVQQGAGTATQAAPRWVHQIRSEERRVGKEWTARG